MNHEICNECGISGEIGSGLYVNRIPDFDDYEQRVENHNPYPEGEFICIECDENINSIKK